MNWCNIDFNKKVLKYNDEIIFDFNWNAPEIFKLTFNNNELINIEHIEENWI